MNIKGGYIIMKRNQKPRRLFTALAIALSGAVIGLGGVTFTTLQKVRSLTGEVTEMKNAAAEAKEYQTAMISQFASLDQSVSDLKEAIFGSDGADQTQPEGNGQMVDGVLTNQAGAEINPEASSDAGALKPPSGESTSTFSQVKDTSLDDLMNQIQANLPAGNGNWGCYVCNLAEGTEGSFGDSPMQSASLIKLFIMGAVYEKYDELSAAYGAEALESLIHPMIIVSDNDAANKLTTYLGGGDSTAGRAAVDAFCKEHGYSGTHMGRLLLAPNDVDDNYTTVADCGHFLREIYEVCNGTKQDSTLQHCNEMFDHLKAQTKRGKIPAQMPAGVLVANKTGELGDVENDAGIIYDTGKTDCVIVFMSEHLSAAGYAQTAIASSSLAIYNYFNS